jgi:hypothetical protein
MNTNKRFLILDRRNVALRPCDYNYHGPDQQGDKSPSFLSEGAAKAFGDFLAKKLVGQRFYLASVNEAVVQYTDPAPAGEWVTTATDAE